jgi:hypothetical protein
LEFQVDSFNVLPDPFLFVYGDNLKNQTDMMN